MIDCIIGRALVGTRPSCRIDRRPIEEVFDSAVIQLDDHSVSGPQFVDTFVNRVRCRYVAILEQLGQRRAIDTEIPPQSDSHCLDLGGEDEVAVTLCVVKGLLTETVAGQPEPTFKSVPSGQGEHPVESSKSRLEAPSIERLDDDFSVARTAKFASIFTEIGEKPFGVVDLAVVGDVPSTTRRPHWLVPGRSQIDDGQSSVSEKYFTPIVGPHPGVVWSPVSQSGGCEGETTGQFIGRLRRSEANNPRDAAHTAETSSSKVTEVYTFSWFMGALPKGRCGV